MPPLNSSLLRCWPQGCRLL